MIPIVFTNAMLMTEEICQSAHRKFGWFGKFGKETMAGRCLKSRQKGAEEVRSDSRPENGEASSRLKDLTRIFLKTSFNQSDG
jgi:hypothetical protein